MATTYTLTANPGGLTATGQSSPLAISGLTPGVDYNFTVHATHEGGTSSESEASGPYQCSTAVTTDESITEGLAVTDVIDSALSLGGAPLMVYEYEVVDAPRQLGSVILNWNSAAGAMPIWYYELRYGPTPEGGTQYGTNIYAPVQTYIVSGLTPGTEYYFNIRTVDTNGIPSDPTQVVFTPAVTYPPTPAILNRSLHESLILQSKTGSASSALDSADVYSDGFVIPAAGTAQGPAGVYPSTLTVSGVVGVTTKVTVSLFGITHTYTGDIIALLEDPTGDSVVLLGYAGGNNGAIDVNITLDDSAATPVNTSDQLVTGTFQPSKDIGSYDMTDEFAPPAPQGSSYPSDFSGFLGLNPNGVWKLYVMDAAGGDNGSITGWSLKVLYA